MLAVGLGLMAVPAAAQGPVAVVEDIAGAPAGVRFMDYLAVGTVIQLGSKDVLTLGYIRSCWRETITGGAVTVGPEQSIVAGGRVDREKVECDGGKMQLIAAQAGKSAVMVFRAPLKPGAAPTLPAPQVTLYGPSPVIDLKGGGKVVFERLDEPGERQEIVIGAGQLMRGSFYDFAKADKALSAGGLYLVSAGAKQVVVKIDSFAKSGQAPIIGRLLIL